MNFCFCFAKKSVLRDLCFVVARREENHNLNFGFWAFGAQRWPLVTVILFQYFLGLLKPLFLQCSWEIWGFGKEGSWGEKGPRTQTNLIDN